MKLIEHFTVAPRSGAALVLKKDHVVRFSLPEGPQVIDFNAFNAADTRESFSSSVTRAYERVHPTTGTHLFSRPPYERVLFEIVADTVRHEPNPRGGASHDLLYGRCSRAYRIMHYGVDSPGCQENIAAAIAKFGLGDEHVHDAFNIFMRTGIEPDGTMFFEASDARKGDYLELRALIDAIIGVATCPGRSSGPVSHPIAVEILGPANP
jgi:uncharacterized protein YcgI (DUF1989 family)